MELNNKSDQTINFVEQQIAHSLSRFIKDKIGKGPSEIKVKIVDNYVICCFCNFMTKAEMLIIESGHPEKVSENRSLYKKQCFDEIESIFKSTLNKKIKHFLDNYILEDDIAYWTIIMD